MTSEFGLLSYDSINLGDEIQSLAARRFLPRVDRFVPREDLTADPGGEGRTKVILNGWFLRHPRRWPPHGKIFPLLVSFHLSTQRRSRWSLQGTPAEIVLAPRNLDWFRRHGPVGARDPHTLELLQSHGVDSYYSGCLTLTLPPRDEALARDYVVASDLHPEALAALAKRTRRPPVVVEHHDRHVAGAEARMARAQSLLDIYARAKAVVTSRLHCALPCLALGTPVLFIPNAEDPHRQVPAMQLAHHQSAREFLCGRSFFDPEDPPSNPGAYRALARKLVEDCEAFIRS